MLKARPWALGGTGRAETSNRTAEGCQLRPLFPGECPNGDFGTLDGLGLTFWELSVFSDLFLVGGVLF